MIYKWTEEEKLHRLLDDMRMLSSGGPDAAAVAAAPVLEEYRCVIGQAFALSGVVSGHPHIGEGGKRVITSQLFYLDRARGLARTMNRLYRLGSSGVRGD